METTVLHENMMIENEQGIMCCAFCGSPLYYHLVGFRIDTCKEYLPCTCQDASFVALRDKIAKAQKRGKVVYLGTKQEYALTPHEMLSVLSGMPVGYTDPFMLERWEEKDLAKELKEALKGSDFEDLLEVADLYSRAARGYDLRNHESAELADRILKYASQKLVLLVF
jgi:hypothetical protein